MQAGATILVLIGSVLVSALQSNRKMLDSLPIIAMKGDGSSNDTYILNDLTVASDLSYDIIFANGFLPGWFAGDTFGCIDCNFADGIRKRSSSLASIYATMAPWSSLVIGSTSGGSFEVSSNTLLKFFAAGSALTRSEIFLVDTLGRKFSQSFSFASAAFSPSTTFSVLGSDAQGFVNSQLSLGALASSDVPTSWNQIWIRDASGLGFILQLDDISIGSPASESGTVPQTADLGSSISDAPPPPSTLQAPPPVYGSSSQFGFLPMQIDFPPSSLSFPSLPTVPLISPSLLPSSAPNQRYIMKLAPGSTFTTLTNICMELQGLSAGLSRFSGSCDPIHQTDSYKSFWPYQSFTVSSPDDLASMTQTLADQVSFFEPDYSVAMHDTVQDIQPLVLQGRSLSSDSVSKAALIQTSAAPTSSVPMSNGVRSWGLDRIDQVSLPLDGIFNPGPGVNGQGTHIFVLDTGVRSTHVDFNGRIGTSTWLVGSSFQDDNGHGTHVSGTAAGSIHGVAKGSILHAVKVLDANGTGYYSTIINGLGWVKNQVSSNNIQAAIVSLSITGPRSAALNDAITSLSQANIKVVVAAGNGNGGDACSYSPGSCPDAFTVASSQSDDSISPFSNIGSCVFAFAPGTYITSAGKDSDSQEVIMSGTSSSTPHIAGAIALILQRYPTATNAQVKVLLATAADPITFSSSSPPRLLNVMESRLQLLQPPPPILTSSPSPPPPLIHSPPPSVNQQPVVKTNLPPPPHSPPPAQQVPFATSSPPPNSFAPIPFPIVGSTPANWCALCPSCLFCS